VEWRAHEGPLERGSAEPGVLPMTSVAPRPHAQLPRTSPVGGSAMLMPKTRVPSSGVRTQGQKVSMTQRTLEALSA
jgi:hypothetical protein